MRTTSVATAALLASILAVAPVAHADPPEAQAIANSSTGFLGCVMNAPLSAAHCFAAQVPIVGPFAGALTVDAWTCSSSAPDGRLVSEDKILVAPSHLEVRPDGSFSLGVDLPTIGRVEIAGAGINHHDAGAVVGVSGVGGMPLGYNLVSPGSGITNYFDDGYGMGAFGALPPPTLVRATVDGAQQMHLIGSVWNTPTTGERDFVLC